jgi:hypothetical protein
VLQEAVAVIQRLTGRNFSRQNTTKVRGKRGKRVFITYAQGTFFGMSEPGEASKRR